VTAAFRCFFCTDSRARVASGRTTSCRWRRHFNAFNTDLTGLFDKLGWERAVVTGHDLGASIAIDLANRHPDRVGRLVILDDSTPALDDAFAAAGIPAGNAGSAVYDYVRRQGRDADALVAELDTPERRRRYVAPEMLDRPVQQPVLILVGADQVTKDDHVEQRCAIAYPEAVGPFWVKGAGHFLPWERPELVNRAIRSFCGDLLVS
jgi:pimeloyl-ACP methyl ester carboxylesterase